MIEDPLAGIRVSLEADGYEMAVGEPEGGRIAVVVSAGPDACADCLVPPTVMAAILAEALDVPPESIDITYPETEPDSQQPGET